MAIARVRIESVGETRATRRRQKKGATRAPEKQQAGVPVAEETGCARLEVVHHTERHDTRIRAGADGGGRGGVAVIGVIGDLVGTV